MLRNAYKTSGDMISTFSMRRAVRQEREEFYEYLKNELGPLTSDDR